MLQLTVTDIRQWTYCRRIVYFTYVMPVERKISFKMEYGQEKHREVTALEKRRLLKRYGLERAERVFNLYLHSPRRGLSGVVDMALKNDQFYYPVEFKHSSKSPFANHKLQLMAYAVLLEDALDAQAPFGFVYNTWTKRTYRIEFDVALRSQFDASLQTIRQMVQTERMPEPTKQQSKCVDCEFRNWCGDVL